MASTIRVIKPEKTNKIVSPQKLNAYFDAMETFLKETYPDCILMPTIAIASEKNAGKQPLLAHKNVPSAKLWDEWSKNRKRFFENGSNINGLSIILRKNLLVIDIDSHEYATLFENQFPIVKTTSIQTTRTGKHYFFVRSKECDDAKLIDKARCLGDLPIDIKTVCSTGTGGIISIYPSPNKKWIRAPYNYAPIEMPNEVFNFIMENHKDYKPKPGRHTPTVQAVQAVIQNQEFTIENNECDRDIKTAKIIVQKCISIDRVTDYSSWINLGICLENISTTLLDDWVAISRRSPKFKSDAECIEYWGKFQRSNATNITGMGTLRMWAKIDNPIAYEECKNTQVKETSIHDFTELAEWLKCKSIFSPTFSMSPDGIKFQGKCNNENVQGVIRFDSRAVILDNGTYIGSLCDKFAIKETLGFFHNDIDPRAMNYMCDIVSEKEAIIQDSTSKVSLFNSSTAAFAKVNVCGKREVTIDNKNKILQLSTVISNAIQSEMKKNFNGITNNLFVNNGTIIIQSNPESNDFVKLCEKLLWFAASKGHKKANGYVYVPIENCPCAFTRDLTYKQYINKVFKNDPIYHKGQRLYKDMLEFMNNYIDEDDMPEFEVDPNILSFENGALKLAENEFIEYATMPKTHPVRNLVARHHITQAYTGVLDTPLFNKITSCQFDTDIADLLCAMIGRLFFKVSQLDRWQVMPYLVGAGGTGKSLILCVIQEMFRKGSIGNLAAKREEVFGIDNIMNKELVMGRDLPIGLSKCLNQEAMQAMTSGEEMEVARKGQVAINEVWTAPVIMASNHMPDYVNTGNNVGRRIVTFRFDTVITNPQEDLLPLIIENELPNIVARCIAAYHVQRTKTVANGGFWKSVPQKVLDWQQKLASSTNKLHNFLSMEDEERGWTIKRVVGHVTWLSVFKEAFENHEMGNKLTNDYTTFQQFKFLVSTNYENVCKSCTQLAKGRGEKCCDKYGVANRVKKIVVFDMFLSPFVVEEIAE